MVKEKTQKDKLDVDAIANKAEKVEGIPKRGYKKSALNWMPLIQKVMNEGIVKISSKVADITKVRNGAIRQIKTSETLKLSEFAFNVRKTDGIEELYISYKS